MRLTKDEAISVVAFLSGGDVSGKTKLNKLLARLNLFMIPTEIEFSLNKWGSHDSGVDIRATELYGPFNYTWDGGTGTGLRLSPPGKSLAEETIQKKLLRILDKDEFSELKNWMEASQYAPASQLSEDEHKELLVDVDDRPKLVARINSVHIDLLDFRDALKGKSTDMSAEITLHALVEYCFYLSKFLKELVFKNIEDKGYDFDANMYHYYFLYLLEKDVVPLLKEQLDSEELDERAIRRRYEFFVNGVPEGYPFSIHNEDLKKLL